MDHHIVSTLDVSIIGMSAIYSMRVCRNRTLSQSTKLMATAVGWASSPNKKQRFCDRRTADVKYSPQSKHIYIPISSSCLVHVRRIHRSECKQNPQSTQNKTEAFIVDIFRHGRPLRSCCRWWPCCPRPSCRAFNRSRAFDSHNAVTREDSVGTATLGIAVRTGKAQDYSS